jgi:hypothetical protein
MALISDRRESAPQKTSPNSNGEGRPFWMAWGVSEKAALLDWLCRVRAHARMMNVASVFWPSLFIEVELTGWKARTLPPK